mmetsp:Transcript_7947/g.19774  ORF Transcript_7947/g.19774 Transcript_7947/m.19774 type:complete len:621 (-) Transcript_7947:248-2110(-)
MGDNEFPVLLQRTLRFRRGTPRRYLLRGGGSMQNECWKPRVDFHRSGKAPPGRCGDQGTDFLPFAWKAVHHRFGSRRRPPCALGGTKRAPPKQQHQQQWQTSAGRRKRYKPEPPIASQRFCLVLDDERRTVVWNQNQRTAKPKFANRSGRRWQRDRPPGYVAGMVLSRVLRSDARDGDSESILQGRTAGLRAELPGVLRQLLGHGRSRTDRLLRHELGGRRVLASGARPGLPRGRDPAADRSARRGPRRGLQKPHVHLREAHRGAPVAARVLQEGSRRGDRPHRPAGSGRQRDGKLRLHPHPDPDGRRRHEGRRRDGRVPPGRIQRRFDRRQPRITLVRNAPSRQHGRSPARSHHRHEGRSGRRRCAEHVESGQDQVRNVRGGHGREASGSTLAYLRRGQVHGLGDHRRRARDLPHRLRCHRDRVGHEEPVGFPSVLRDRLRSQHSPAGLSGVASPRGRHRVAVQQRRHHAAERSRAVLLLPLQLPGRQGLPVLRSAGVPEGPGPGRRRRSGLLDHVRPPALPEGGGRSAGIEFRERLRAETPQHVRSGGLRGPPGQPQARPRVLRPALRLGPGKQWNPKEVAKGQVGIFEYVFVPSLNHRSGDVGQKYLQLEYNTRPLK